MHGHVSGAPCEDIWELHLGVTWGPCTVILGVARWMHCNTGGYTGDALHTMPHSLTDGRTCALNSAVLVMRKLSVLMLWCYGTAVLHCTTAQCTCFFVPPFPAAAPKNNYTLERGSRCTTTLQRDPIRSCACSYHVLPTAPHTYLSIALPAPLSCCPP